MTTYIQIWRDSKQYTFNVASFHATMNYPVYLVGTGDWGLSPAHRITQRGPFQNGDTDIDFRLDPRIINLPIVVPAINFADMMQKRSDLMKVFKHGNDNINFRLVWNDGVHGSQYRQVDARIAGGLQLDANTQENIIRGVLQLRCANPTWYNDAVQNYDLTSASFGDPTLIPKPYPVTYGSNQNSANAITSFTYDGSWNADPVITINGELNSIVMTDTLGHEIKINSVPSGQQWTITLGYNISVVDQNGINKFSQVDITSNLVQWAVYAESGTVPNGANTISVSATGPGNIFMEFLTRYIGV